MMDEGRSSRGIHTIRLEMLPRVKLRWVWIVHSGPSTFFFSLRIGYSSCMHLVTAWVELAIQIGDRFFSLYSWYTHTKKTNSQRALVFSVMSSFPFYLNSKRRRRRRKRKRFDAEDFLWKGRWSGHASSPTDSARKCRSWNAWSMSTEMKAVLVGQPSFAFLFKRFPFFFSFSPPFPLVPKEGM